MGQTNSGPGGFLIYREPENAMFLSDCIAFRPVGQHYESFAFEQISGFDSKGLCPGGDSID